MNASATTLLRGTAWCARGARALRRAAVGSAPSTRHAAVVVPTRQHGRGFRPAQAALKQSDAETDDEFLAMTDGELNRGSRLAQQVRPAEAPSSVDAHSQINKSLFPKVPPPPPERHDERDFADVPCARSIRI
jgi:hypothetical protein